MVRVVVNTRDFEAAVEELVRRAKNAQPALKAWGLHMVGSVKRNFQEQGRPDPWKPLKVNTLIARYLRGKASGAKAGGQFAPNPNVFKASNGRLSAGDSGAVSTVAGFARNPKTGRVAQRGSGGLNKFAASGMVFKRPALRAILSGKILLDTGRLRGSIVSDVVSGTEVQIGTNVKYAGVQQFGGGKSKLVARPFLVIQADDEAEFASLLTDWLSGAWGKS